jgi:MFS superfamily sulfate permease-like transporter
VRRGHRRPAAIGVIIVSKQAHVALGVTPEGAEPLHLLAQIPHSLLNLNPEVFAIGLTGLAILYGMPLIRARWARMVPSQMIVLLVAVPMGLAFGLGTEHVYEAAGHAYKVGPNFLIRLPASLLSALAFPDFSQVFSPVSIKYIVMFSLVGSIESLLSVTAVDSLDPERRTSDLNKDLLATGISNVVAASLGGLPMISEIVRSKANIDNGAQSRWSNFYHGAFLLLSLAVIPGLLQMIPLAALAAMLIYTGTRLASPSEFIHAYHVGPEQLLIFTVTMLVTLMTDLLIGVAAGLVLKVLLHLYSGAPIGRFFSTVVDEVREGDAMRLTVHDAAIFTNYLGLKRRLLALPDDVRTVIIDFDQAWVVDHTVLAKVEALSRTWTDRTLQVVGLDGHRSTSHHPLAARRKIRVGVAA